MVKTAGPGRARMHGERINRAYACILASPSTNPDGSAARSHGRRRSSGRLGLSTVLRLPVHHWHWSQCSRAVSVLVSVLLSVRARPPGPPARAGGRARQLAAAAADSESPGPGACDGMGSKVDARAAATHWQGPGTPGYVCRVICASRDVPTGDLPWSLGTLPYVLS